ncbi:MAG: DUF378 domain-containing protein [Verrucomicrobia bacterium]|nr:DUF378 domain-containing protein [Verrucomicrobiota bacterium]
MSSVKLKMLGKLGKIMFLTAGKKLARGLDRISMVLLLLAGLNWGTVGVAHVDLVSWVFGPMSAMQHIFYVAFGLSAIWAIVRLCFRRMYK